MLNWAIDKFVPTELISEKIESLQISMEELKDFVYIWGIDKSVSLSGFKEMGNTAKLAIYVSRLEQLRVDPDPSFNKKNLFELVRKILDSEEEKETGKRLSIVENVVETEGHWFAHDALDQKLISLPSEKMKLTIFVAYSDNSAVKIEDIQKLLSSCPIRKSNDTTELSSLHDKLDELQKILESQKIVAKRGLDYTFRDLLDRAQEKARKIFVLTITH